MMYSKREWLLLRVGLFSMARLAMISLMVGMTGMMVGSRTFTLTAAGGLAAAAVVGGVTAVILQITGRLCRDSR